MSSPERNPMDPPLLMPDAPGADADSRGLPALTDLSFRYRQIVRTSALVDIGLRTLVGSLVSLAIVTSVIAGGIRRSKFDRERAAVRFYAQLAGLHDPAQSFPAPRVAPKVATRPANALAQRAAKAHVENLRFASTFEPVNPAMRDEWKRLARNNIVRAQHWRHPDGPRPTLCVIHGFGASRHLLNGAAFCLPLFYRREYDVLLYTLPFHGQRAEKYSPFSGFGYYSRGLAGVAEAMAQAVHDFRSVLDYLRATGVEKIALTGMSLGGYTASLIASVDNRVDAVIPNVPVVEPAAVIDSWFPLNRVLQLSQRFSSLDREESENAAAFHSPLNYRPLVPRDRRLIITGLGDRLAEPVNLNEAPLRGIY